MEIAGELSLSDPMRALANSSLPVRQPAAETDNLLTVGKDD
jgi:hypothetical protein